MPHALTNRLPATMGGHGLPLAIALRQEMKDKDYDRSKSKGWTLKLCWSCAEVVHPLAMERAPYRRIIRISPPFLGTLFPVVSATSLNPVDYPKRPDWLHDSKSSFLWSPSFGIQTMNKSTKCPSLSQGFVVGPIVGAKGFFTNQPLTNYVLGHAVVQLKYVRCNLDVCPELMSRSQPIVQKGWLILIPHEDKVDVVSPFSILVKRDVADFVP